MKTAVFAAALCAPLLAAPGAVLWLDPGPVESLDLAGGPAGAASAPRPPFTFVEEEPGGTAPKILVKDAAGATWSVKFGEEVKAENFATRIAWAAGYYADPTFYVPQGTIVGVKDLGRARAFVDAGGAFRAARFELRDDSIRLLPGSKWNLDSSAVKGSRELAGLKLLLILLSNWDVKPQNFAVMHVRGRQRYAVTDWGASMGRASDITGRSKWDCELYTRDTEHLVQGVDNGFVVLNYNGKSSAQVLQNIRVEDVVWLVSRLGKLSDAQIASALRTSGATEDETACFAKAFRARLDKLAAVPNLPRDGGVTTTTIRRETRTIRRTVPAQ